MFIRKKFNQIINTLSNILFYTDTPNIGGAEKQMTLLAKYLRLRGCSVSLAYGKYSALGRHPELLSGYDQVFVLNASHKHDPRHYFELKKILGVHKFDLIHLHLWNPGACRYAFFAAASAKVPIITTEHDPFELHGIKRFIKLACLRRTNHTITISNAGRDDMRRWYNIPEEKISVVHNGIEFDTFTQCHSDPDLSGEESPQLQNHMKVGFVGDSSAMPQNDTRITCVAELHERKGHKYLLKAFSRLQSKMPNLHLQLVGTGSLKKELKSRYGMNPNIHFLGWRDDVPAILRASDIFVLPSLKEAFGLSVLEAMASGVAVIATNTGGPAEIIENGKNGILVTPANADAIAEAIKQLLADSNKKRALEEAARQRVHEFSAEHMAEGTMRVYAQCHSER